MENDSIGIPLNRLDSEMQMIEFALMPSRLVFLDDVNIWLDFYKEYSNNHTDYSTYELHQYFTNNILPKIQEYSLSESQFTMLNLLRLHPAFTETENGFQLTKVPLTYLNERDLPEANKHITISPQINISKGKIKKPILGESSSTSTQDSNKGLENMDFDCRTVLLTQSNEKSSSSILNRCKGSQLSSVNTGLFSILFSNDKEVGLNIILSITEVYVRFSKCKQIFEDTAQLPNTFITPVTTLLDCLRFSQKILIKLDTVALNADNRQLQNT